MALTVTSHAGGGGTGSAASLAINSVTAAVGSTLVVLVGADNNGTSGASSISSVTDSAGNSYAQQAIVNQDPGAAAAGATLGVFTAKIATALSGGTVTVNFSPNTAGRSAEIIRAVPDAGFQAQIAAVDTTGSTGSVTSHSAATVSVTSGNTIIGAAAIETNATVTGDSDTTNGNWSTVVTRSSNSGTDATSMCVSSQFKTVSSTGNQSWACTTGSAKDSARSYIIIRQVPILDAGAGSYAVTGQAATLKRARKVAAGAGGYSLAGTAATLRRSGDPLALVTDGDINDAATSPATFAGLDLGPAAADRINVVHVTGTNLGDIITVTGVSVAGNAATRVVRPSDSPAALFSELWQVPLSGGTSGNVVVTFTGASSEVSAAVTVYAIYGFDPAVHDTDNDPVTGGDGSNTLDIPENGLVISATTTIVNPANWTGVNDDFVQIYLGGFAYQATGSRIVASAEPGAAITASGATGLVSASWGPPAGLTISAGAGSYALTGTAATLERGRKVAAAPGGYGLTGAAALLKHGWKAAAGTGSYSIGGQAVGLLGKKKAGADPGSYAFTGQGSVLTRGFNAAAVSGSYGVWGQDAALITAANRVTIAGAGGYGLSGAAIPLLHRREIAAGVGAYALEGQQGSLLRALRAAAEAGGYSLTGLDPGLTLAPAPPPEVTARRHGADDRQEYERWLRKWQESLRRIIERSWRIANGEIDPVTLEPIPQPDLQGLAAALGLVEEARDRAALDAIVAENARRQEEEAITVLLLAA
ncbi:MAG: hypothetical protein AB7F74_21270 [Parvibaculaceae bacterium]